MRQARRIYEALLHAYPDRTRLARGDDMAQLFTDQLRDAASLLGQARVWVQAIADIALTAPREHVEWRRRIKVVEGPIVDQPTAVRRDALVALVPMMLSIALIFVRPPGYEAMYDARVSVLGLPFGVFGLIGGAVLAAVGILIARRNPFADPAVQALVMGVLLAPIPVLWLLGEPSMNLIVYAVVATQLVLVSQFRRVMLLLVIPFVVWVVLGPIVVTALIGLGSAGMNS